MRETLHACTTVFRLPLADVLEIRGLPILGDVPASVIWWQLAVTNPEVADVGPADHLAIKLRLRALCCAKEAEGWRSGDSKTATEWLAREQRLLKEHVLA